jgi:hypothetical protein
MSHISFNIDIGPLFALNMIRNNQEADLIYEESHEVGENKFIGTQIYEKYYFRTSNRAALIVMIDNLKGATNVRAVCTGSSDGLLFSFDWGAADDFVHSVKDILSKHVIE